jgi:hypothetical protein
MRDRLIELILECSTFTPEYAKQARLLAEYLAQHLLNEGVIVPPCKVGDKAYHLTGIDTREELDLTDIFEGKVCSISKQEDALWIFCRYNNGLTYWYTESDIGRKLFLTQEKVEKALVERSENGT